MKDSISPWLENIHIPDFPQLSSSITTETVVIGAGIAGATTAYLLAKAGKDIVLIDKATPAESTTAYTTAHLSQDLDTEYTDLVSYFGKEKAKLIWESHGTAIDTIENIAKDEQIDCDFLRCPVSIFANDTKELDLLKEEFKTAKETDIPITMHKTSLPFPSHGYIRIERQAKFHPVKYLKGLIDAAHQHGAKIYYNTEATDIAKNSNDVRTNHGTIHAKNIIITTHLPFNKPIQTFAKKGAYVTYVIRALIPKRAFPHEMFWDMSNPYHYFRIDNAGSKDSIILGGEDHRKGLPVKSEKAYAKLESYLQKILKDHPYELTHRWNGPIIENASVALIGAINKTQYVATAFSGNGITYGTIAGILFRDAILKKKNPWADIYDPKKIPSIKQILGKARDYTEELMNSGIKNIA
jgi:glycine/D-amino acid oxidase-like deaminating enzyme